jgi:Ca2+-binding EF-hand superfamily protein
MSDLGLKISESQIRMVFDSTDKGNKGKIDFPDFIKLLTYDATPASFTMLNQRPSESVRLVAARSFGAPVKL